VPLAADRALPVAIAHMIGAVVGIILLVVLFVGIIHVPVPGFR
jgi:hypothetical protein